jgi:hypothetical protein
MVLYKFILSLFSLCLFLGIVLVIAMLNNLVSNIVKEYEIEIDNYYISLVIGFVLIILGSYSLYSLITLDERRNNVTLLYIENSFSDDEISSIHKVLDIGKSNVILLPNWSEIKSNKEAVNKFNEFGFSGTIIGIVPNIENSELNNDQLIDVVIRKLTKSLYHSIILISNEKYEIYEDIRVGIPVDYEKAKEILTSKRAIKTGDVKACSLEITKEMSFEGQIVQKIPLKELNLD